MKATITVDSFKRAYSAASSVVPSRSPKPILQHVKATFGDKSSLVATDLEVGIRHDIWGEKVSESGVVLLPQAFGQILDTTPDKELSLDSGGDSLTVRGERSEFVLSIEDAGAYPDVVAVVPEDHYQIPANDLRTAILRTIFATDVEQTRYALGGLLFEVSGSSLGVVGTDGRRLARHALTLDSVGTPNAPKSPVVPCKVLKLIGRNLPEGSVAISLAFVGESIVFKTELATITSRLVEGRFPRYQDVFPKGEPIKIPISAMELLAVTQQASIATSEESRGIDFEFGPGVLRLKSQAAQKGKSTVEMPIDYAGTPIVLTFDPRYITDALRAIGEQEITIELIDATNAAVLRTQDGYCYVVMPLTRESA